MKKSSELRSFRELLAEELERDPEFRAEYERLATARAISTMVTKRRFELGLSQTALAKLVGVSQPVIARIEGAEHNPTLDTLIKLSNALDLEIVLGITPAGREKALINIPAEGATSVSETTTLGSQVIISAA
ncbi:MAG TPA: helix-turn-helix domain-containing protein [Thermomicrobiales bacterium]|nr:helix-turn-helix domain-containing protein [Thermomicrobiales bacterium]